jgi:flagellar basal-body rod modification protein FlgD
MIPLAISAASAALGMISSVAQSATSSDGAANGAGGTSGAGARNGAGATKNGAAAGSSAGKGRENDVVNQAEFMKLLIAQLQNQDPLNPMDSANFSAQLAQFSSLEQLTEINGKLGKAAGDTVGRFDAVGFIGRDVRGPSAGIAVKGGVATTLDYTLESAGTVQAKIVDQSGRQVASVILDGEGAGAHTLDLSKVTSAPHLDDGTYAVVLSQASPSGGTPTQVDTFVSGRVTGVDLTGDTPTLLLGDRKLVLADVTEVKEPAPASGA